MKFLMILLLSAAAFAQNAVVVQLETFDAKEVREAYQAKIKADAAWELVRQRVYTNYVKDRSDFPFGFEFSTDLWYIVPAKPPAPVISGSCWLPNGASTWSFPMPATYNSHPISDGNPIYTFPLLTEH